MDIRKIGLQGIAVGLGIITILIVLIVAIFFSSFVGVGFRWSVAISLLLFIVPVGLMFRGFAKKAWRSKKIKGRTDKHQPNKENPSANQTEETKTSKTPSKRNWWKTIILTVLLIWLIGYVIGPLIALSFSNPRVRERFGMAPLPQGRVYPYYKPDKCDPRDTQLENLENRSDLAGQVIKISLGRGEGKGSGEGCYGYHIIFPKICSPSARCFFEKSQEPGDYASLWCDNEAGPRPIRSEEYKYFLDPGQSLVSGGDLRNCRSPDADTFAFSVEGRGDICVAVTPSHFDPSTFVCK